MMLIDGHGREHNYLRISLTEKCNLRCNYCMPENGIVLRNKSHFMNADEVIALAKTFVNLGVKKIRITGGEPFVNKDISQILKQLNQFNVDLSITSNAILLSEYFELLEQLNIRSLNLSIDSLNEEKFNAITRRNLFDTVIKNINEAIHRGFKVKLNVVVIKGVNDDEIVEFVRWSIRESISVRFIEFMPFDGNQWKVDKVLSQKKMLEIIAKEFTPETIQKIQDEKNLISRNYKIEGAKGSFGFISTITNSFCGTCNRIRLTADGKIKNCLFSNEELDLLSALRNGEDVTAIIQKAIQSKHPKNAGIDFGNQNYKNRSMTAIGG